MSKTIANVLAKTVEASLVFTGKRNRNRAIALMVDRLQHRGVETFSINGKTVKYLTRQGPFLATMVKNFEKDEPETLEWLDTIVESGNHMWDIGANVGLYTVYAGACGAKVSAFEPSALNYNLLNEQIHINDLSETVRAYCLGFSDKTGVEALHVRDMHAGNVFNTVGEATNQFGEFKASFAQGILTYTVDDFIEFSGLPVPQHVKLDVDGIELKILKGANRTFSQIKSLIIEIEGDEKRQKELIDTIKAFGLLDATDKLKSQAGRNRLFLRD